MPNLCSKQEVRGCPASFYLSCPAFRAGKNCWEVDTRPCCAAARSDCPKCNTFSKARSHKGGQHIL